MASSSACLRDSLRRARVARVARVAPLVTVSPSPAPARRLVLAANRLLLYDIVTWASAACGCLEFIYALKGHFGLVVGVCGRIADLIDRAHETRLGRLVVAAFETQFETLDRSIAESERAFL